MIHYVWVTRTEPVTRPLSPNMITAPSLALPHHPQSIRAFSIGNRMTVRRIQNAVARFYRVPLAELLSSRKSRDISRPRQVAMYLAKKLTNQSYPEIGRRFGGRDHTTIIHGVRQVEKLIEEDEDFAIDVQVVREMLEE